MNRKKGAQIAIGGFGLGLAGAWLGGIHWALATTTAAEAWAGDSRTLLGAVYLMATVLGVIWLVGFGIGALFIWWAKGIGRG